MPTALSAERRAALLGAKLRALVASRSVPGASSPEPAVFPGGAAVVGSDTAWVYVDESPLRALGPALAWARRRQRAVEVVVDEPTAGGVLARRAAQFLDPPPVWVVDGGELVAARPEPFAPAGPTPDGLLAWAATLVELLRAHDVEVAVEDGTVVGEVLGLEVARIVADPDGEPRLEVGVGRHDREVVAMLGGDRPATESLAAVVEVVRRHRRAEAEPHPLNRLAAERWLRARLLGDPSHLGLVELEPLPTVVPRAGLREVMPAAARGRDPNGAPVLVVCSVGIDLDLVPTAADVRQRWATEADTDPSAARLVVVLPERDAHPATRELLASLRDAAELSTVEDGWRR